MMHVMTLYQPTQSLASGTLSDYTHVVRSIICNTLVRNYMYMSENLYLMPLSSKVDKNTYNRLISNDKAMNQFDCSGVRPGDAQHVSCQ